MTVSMLALTTIKGQGVRGAVCGLILQVFGEGVRWGGGVTVSMLAVTRPRAVEILTIEHPGRAESLQGIFMSGSCNSG